jgi:putative hydrolase of the HAD superfamily
VAVKAVIFDWGGTLMREFPEYYTNANADLSQAEAMPVAEDALQALYGKYTLCVASNALASYAGQVQRALERVGIARYFGHIFTVRELNASIPDPEFFNKILFQIKVTPS